MSKNFTVDLIMTKTKTKFQSVVAAYASPGGSSDDDFAPPRRSGKRKSASAPAPTSSGFVFDSTAPVVKPEKPEASVFGTSVQCSSASVDSGKGPRVADLKHYTLYPDIEYACGSPAPSFQFDVTSCQSVQRPTVCITQVLLCVLSVHVICPKILTMSSSACACQ